MGKDIHRCNVMVAHDRLAARPVADHRRLLLNDPFDDDERNLRPPFPYGHPVNPNITFHWDAQNTLGLFTGKVAFANGTTINANATIWPLDFTVSPLLPAVTFKIYVKGQADNVTGEKAVDNIHGRVVNVDLDVDADYDGKIDEKDEPLEEKVGGLVCVCTNNLTPIKLTLQPAGLTGRVTLRATMGDDRIRLWRNANRTGSVGLDETWTQATMPPELYVEGITNSTFHCDVELRLEYDENPQGQNNPLFTCADVVRLTIIKVDLDIDIDDDGDIDEDDEADEEQVGKFMWWNADDENNNGTLDKDEEPTGGISGEDELVEVALSITPALSSGNARLKITEVSTRIKVWEEQSKQNKLTPAGTPPSFSWAVGSMPDRVYVEGVDGSEDLRDVSLELVYEPTAGTELCPDTVDLTVVPLIIGYVAGKDLRGVDWKPDGSYALLVGTGGSVVKYAYHSFTALSSGTSDRLDGVTWKPDGSFALPVGGPWGPAGVVGLVLKYDGSTFTQLPSVTIPAGKSYVKYWHADWRPSGTYCLFAAETDGQGLHIHRHGNAQLPG